MNFDALNIAGCIVPPVVAPPPPDQRCSDAAFAAAHPDICGSAAYLIIKPATALVCALGSINFSVFLYENGVETQVEDGLTFTSSDEEILAIGVHTGSATGLAEGEAIVTVTRSGLTAQSEMSVLAANTCCDTIQAKTSILIDNSKSTSLAFGGGYSSRLAFAKAAAGNYAATILQVANAPKDSVKIWSFNDVANLISSDFLMDTAELADEINGIQQTQTLTDLKAILDSAIADILTATADKKIIMLISDGEQTKNTLNQPILGSAELFKSAGGIIICIGLRASGAGYDLLSRIASGGFFLNTTANNILDVMQGLNYLKSILCVGDCLVECGNFNTPALDYSSFINWEVIAGQVNLIGAGLLDLQPGNGLYVDLNGGTPATIRTIDDFPIVAGRQYRISFRCAGNNRSDTFSNPSVLVSIKNASGVAPVNFATIFQHVVAPAWDDPFTQFSFTFTALFGADVKILFQQLSDPPVGFSGIWHGNLLDNVKLEEVTTLTTLFSDDFDSENLTGNCSPVITSNTLIPAMTSNTMPSGIASADSEFSPSYAAWKSMNQISTGNFADNRWSSSDTLPHWLSYQFSIPKVVSAYQFYFAQSYAGMPRSWQFQGSNNGSDWVVLDTITNYTNLLDGVKRFEILNTASYLYYRLYITAANAQPNPLIVAAFQLFHESSAYLAYGEVCTSEIPGTQIQDPNPLPDIETNLPSTTTYNSTKTVCKSCPSGSVNLAATSSVPVMTSNATPSGVASGTLESTDGLHTDKTSLAWKLFDGVKIGFPTFQLVRPSGQLQYRFAATKTITDYAVTGSRPPLNFTLQGSNNGSSWADLDVQTGLVWFSGETKRFSITTPASFIYYRLTYDGNGLDSDISILISELELFEAAPSQVCKQANAISYISQADADSKAVAAATALALAELNCVTQYLSSQQYTATCQTDSQLGSLGSDVTRSANASSLISQADADAKALAAAKVLALAALSCSASNNTQKITINDNAISTPYPSVKYVSGKTGLVTKVVVTLNGFAHVYPSDVQILLRAPSGEYAVMMAGCGSSHNVSGLTLVFDDSAGSSLSNAVLTSGTFKPTKLGVFPNFSPPAPQESYTTIPTLLSTFSGIDPNGAWSLWVMDNLPSSAGQIASGWNMEITSI